MQGPVKCIYLERGAEVPLRIRGVGSIQTKRGALDLTPRHQRRLGYTWGQNKQKMEAQTQDGGFHNDTILCFLSAFVNQKLPITVWWSMFARFSSVQNPLRARTERILFELYLPGAGEGVAT